ncbi:MAG: ABC transporter ATP-binding protein, partial [Sandaracinaceae bacterium]|nr:ABC transporter ATP-binding protein [Sandaracinaceae bacterium]
MNSTTQEERTFPLAASEVSEGAAEARAYELIVERVLRLLSEDRTPAQIHDAVVESIVQEGSLNKKSILVIKGALDRLGLRTRLGQGAGIEEAVFTVGSGRPLLIETREGQCILVSDREGDHVHVESACFDPHWMSVSHLLTQAQANAWVYVDPALPLAHPKSKGPPPLERVAQWIRLERQDLWALLIYAIFVGSFSIVLPVAVQVLVNTIALGALLQPLVVLTTLLFGVLAFDAILRSTQFYIVEILQRRIFVRVVADFSFRLPRVLRPAIDHVDSGELVNRFFDVFTFQKTAASILVSGLDLMLTVIVGMLLLAFYHPVLLAFDIILIVFVGSIVVMMGKKGIATAISESKRKYAMAAWLEEIARHDALFKLGGGLEYAELRAEALARAYLKDRELHFGVVFKQTIVFLSLQAVANASVLGMGGFLVMQGQLTLGQLVASELIVTVVVSSIAKFGKYLENFYDLVAAVDKIGQVTDLPIEEMGGAGCAHIGKKGPASLRLEGVRAGYGDGPEVLCSVNLTVEAGQRIGITGAPGTGKTLLVELLAALRKPRFGRIYIDGHDLSEFDITALREKIAVVHPAVVSGSILDNIRLGRVQVDVWAVQQALREVGLLSEIEAMPRGIRTELNSTGEPLSTSQIQRLAIARAIVGNPALLVLDGVLDGFDTEARETILDSLFSDRGRWTLIVTSNNSQVLAR